MSGDTDLLKGLIEAFAASIDPGKLRAELLRRVGTTEPAPDSTSVTSRPKPKTSNAPSSPQPEVLQRLFLEDILDESILGARAGEKSYPLRLFFSQLSESLSDDSAFALLTGMNFYFRVEMDEEVKMRVGYEISRLYYHFIEDSQIELVSTAPLSQLIAALMSTELTRVRFENVDNATTFDSALHERATGGDPGNASIQQPLSFLCRVTANNMVRTKALVKT